MWQRLHDRAYQAIRARTTQPVRLKALWRMRAGIPREPLRTRILNEQNTYA